MFNSRSFVVIRVQNVLQFLNTLGSSQSVYHRLSPGQRSIQPSTRQSQRSRRSLSIWNEVCSFVITISFVLTIIAELLSWQLTTVRPRYSAA